MFPQHKQNTFFQETHITKLQVEVKSSHLLDYLVNRIIRDSRRLGYIIDFADESFCNLRQVTYHLSACNSSYKLKKNQRKSISFPTLCFC